MKLTGIKQLRQAMLRAKGQISDVASAAAEAIEEVAAQKQDELSGTPGQVVGFDSAGKAAAVHGWSNPNLLDNWYFADPVNQQGQAEYTEAGFTIDRWRMDSPGQTLTIGADGAVSSLVFDAGSNRIFRQRMEKIPENTTFTYSLLYKNASGNVYISAGGFGGETVSNVRCINDGLVSVTFSSGDANAINNPRVYIWASANPGGSITPIAAKLELGSVQTLARKEGDTWALNDPPPNKALEVLKCQREYVRFKNKGATAMIVMASGSVNRTSASFSISVPCHMRKKPSLDIDIGWIRKNGVSKTVDMSKFSAVIEDYSESSFLIRITDNSSTETSPSIFNDQYDIYAICIERLILDARN